MTNEYDIHTRIVSVKRHRIYAKDRKTAKKMAVEAHGIMNRGVKPSVFEGSVCRATINTERKDIHGTGKKS